MVITGPKSVSSMVLRVMEELTMISSFIFSTIVGNSGCAPSGTLVPVVEVTVAVAVALLGVCGGVHSGVKISGVRVP